MAKKMVMPFFDQQGAIFTNCVLLVIPVNDAYIVLGIFMKQLKQKRVVVASAGQWFCAGTMPQCTLPPLCASGRQSTTCRCSLTIATHQI
jgi:hypothetical protein